jgi:hypothetical protein
MPNTQARPAALAHGAPAVAAPKPLADFAARVEWAAKLAHAERDRPNLASRPDYAADLAERAFVAVRGAAVAVPPAPDDGPDGPLSPLAALLAVGQLLRLAFLPGQVTDEDTPTDPAAEWRAAAAAVAGHLARLDRAAEEERVAAADPTFGLLLRIDQLHALCIRHAAAIRRAHWRATDWTYRADGGGEWDPAPTSPAEVAEHRRANLWLTARTLADLEAATVRLAAVAPDRPDVAMVVAAAAADVLTWAKAGHERFTMNRGRGSGAGGGNPWHLYTPADLEAWEADRDPALARLRMVAVAVTAERPASHDVPAKPELPRTVDLDATDHAILRALARAAGPLKFAELVPRAKRSDKACREHADALCAAGLVRRIGKGRSGVQITDAGRAVVAPRRRQP